MNHAQPDSSANHHVSKTRFELATSAHTRQRFEPRRAFPARPHPIRARTAPVAPDRDVLQGLVEMSVLHVLRGHDARPAGCVDEVVEARSAGSTVRTRTRRRRLGRAGPVDGDRSARIVGTELDRVDLCALEDLDAAGARMLEQEVVKFGADLNGRRVSALSRAIYEGTLD